MEGLEGIALAGNVIQFVQFASDFVSKVHTIYTEAQDESRNRGRFQNMLQDFILVAARIDATAVPPGGDGASPRGIAVHAEGEKLQKIMRSLAAHSTVLSIYMPRDAPSTSPEKDWLKVASTLRTN